MAYCSFCNVDGLPEEINRDTHCLFCGKLIKEIKPVKPTRNNDSDNTYSVPIQPKYSTGPSYSGGYYSPKMSKENRKDNENFIIMIILALVAGYLFGSTAGLLVIAVGTMIALRHIMKLIIVAVVAVVGFYIAEGMGINGLIGLVIAGSFANFVIRKLFGRK